MIFEYIYNKKKDENGNKDIRGRRKIGMFLAIADSRGGCYTSWSLCNSNAGDEFDRWRALMECNRKLGKADESVPKKIEADYLDFISRSQHYFKEKGARTRKKTNKK